MVTQLVVSFGFIFLDKPTQETVKQWVVASPEQVFEHGRVWTLLTSPLLELDFLQILFTVLMLWLFVPTLERFWGTNRFYRFVAITSVAGTIGGTLMGLATGRDVDISGLQPFAFASIVAFGILYARQPVEFSFYIRMTGRQLMYGMLAFFVLFITLQGRWELGLACCCAMLSAAMMTSKRWSPGLAWRRWRIARARARLSVIEGGKKPKRDEQRWLN